MEYTEYSGHGIEGYACHIITYIGCVEQLARIENVPRRVDHVLRNMYHYSRLSNTSINLN